MMPTRLIDRLEVGRLVERGAQLVEVLPEEEYAYEHLPGAVNVWLRDLDRVAPRRLDRAKPVIVYSTDFL
jgi:rhodanese-related sulfurtransferase